MNDDKFEKIFSLLDFMEDNNLNDLGSPRIKNDYETFKSFVSQFPAWLGLAQKYNKRPDQLLKMFSLIGQEVLNRSNDILVSELSQQIKNKISVSQFKLSDDAISALDNLVQFIKKNNQEVMK